MKLKIVLPLVLIFWVSCGIKGPPLPPLKEAPPKQIVEPQPTPSPTPLPKKKKKK